VLVWREGNTSQSSSWNGPYNLVSIDGESCVLALPYRYTTFRTTVVKLYLTPTTNINSIELQEVNLELTKAPKGETIVVNEGPIQLTQPIKRKRGRPCKYLIPKDIYTN
jgi:hypothetical protein